MGRQNKLTASMETYTNGMLARCIILVIVDHTLGGRMKKAKPYKRQVLILVLVDHALGVYIHVCSKK